MSQIRLDVQHTQFSNADFDKTLAYRRVRARDGCRSFATTLRPRAGTSGTGHLHIHLLPCVQVLSQLAIPEHVRRRVHTRGQAAAVLLVSRVVYLAPWPFQPGIQTSCRACRNLLRITAVRHSKAYRGKDSCADSGGRARNHAPGRELLARYFHRACHDGYAAAHRVLRGQGGAGEARGILLRGRLRPWSGLDDQAVAGTAARPRVRAYRAHVPLAVVALLHPNRRDWRWDIHGDCLLVARRRLAHTLCIRRGYARRERVGHDLRLEPQGAFRRSRVRRQTPAGHSVVRYRADGPLFWRVAVSGGGRWGRCGDGSAMAAGSDEDCKSGTRNRPA